MSVITEGMSFKAKSGVTMFAVKADPEKATIFSPNVPVSKLDVTVYPNESRLAGSASKLPYTSSCSNVSPEDEVVVMAVEEAIVSTLAMA
jgi:hypothetical protein